MITIAQALHDAARRLAPVSESATNDARLLLSAAAGIDRAALTAFPERPLSDDHAAHYAAWIERAAAGEPIPYILGHWPFYDREFIVSPAVLIPRPETELLLQAALDALPADTVVHAADIGTGSGALAVTFAALRPLASVMAVDISEDALAIARANAAQHGVLSRVAFAHGDLLMPVIGAIEAGAPRRDLVMANLPYIPSEDLRELAVTRHEPRLALDGGADGLDLVRRLLVDLPRVVRPGGRALLEIEARQGEAVRLLASRMTGVSRVEVMQDYAGLDRIVRIER